MFTATLTGAGVGFREENPEAGDSVIRPVATPENLYKDMKARGVKFPITQTLEEGVTDITHTPED